MVDDREEDRRETITVRGHLNGYTGYGQHTIAIAKELERLGHPIVFEAVELDLTGYVPIDPFVIPRLRTGS